jgi:predicted NAD/FAD-binding protein
LLAAALPDVRTSTPVASVVRTPTGVEVTTAAGAKDRYDAVVLATHSDISLRLLGDDATAKERELLSAIPYNDNDIYLHTDASLMPVRRTAWASWNFLGTSGQETDTAPVCVTYWLNRLQNLPPEAPQMFVTLNPPQPPAADTIIRRLNLAHPVYRCGHCLQPAQRSIMCSAPGSSQPCSQPAHMPCVVRCQLAGVAHA